MRPRARHLALIVARDTLTCAVALMAARTANAQATTGIGPADAVPYVETVGTGEVRLLPDRATVMVGIETRATNAAAASAASGKIQRAVLDTLRAIGFGESAVRTRDYDVTPEMQRANGRVVRSGYVARLTMAVQLSSLERIGEVLDAALARGATSVGGVEYSLSTADSAQRAALGKAVADAQRQAAAIASALGGSLGQVIMTTTSGGGGGRVVLGYGQGGQGDAFGTGPSIKPAEITVEATVVVRWRYLFR
jgi:uncharacterized protein YggE